MSGKYDDIINLPHYQSKTRHHMSNHDRAAQFAPFAALTGYDLVIKEQQKLYADRVELSEDELAELDKTIAVLKKGDIFTVTYYLDNDYVTETDICTEVNIYRKMIRTGEKTIKFGDIYKLEIVDITD